MSYDSLPKMKIDGEFYTPWREKLTVREIIKVVKGSEENKYGLHCVKESGERKEIMPRLDGPQTEKDELIKVNDYKKFYVMDLRWEEDLK